MRCIATALACSIAVAALDIGQNIGALAGDTPQPGLWQSSSKTERSGIVKERPTRTRCFSLEQARDFARRLVRDFNSPLASCQSVDAHDIENGKAWRLVCTGILPTSGTGSYVFDSPQHYIATFQSRVQFLGKFLQSTLTIEGKRVGECPK